MVKEACHRLTSPVTWMTRMELAWQLSTTTVKTEHWWMGTKRQVVTDATLTTQERVCLSWRVSPQSPHTASSLSNMSVIIRLFGITRLIQRDGGCHVIQLRWCTGVEHHLAVVRAHAGWPAHVHAPVLVVTVMRMTMYGVKTAVFSLTNHVFQSNSSGLEILAVAASKVTTHWENWSALEQRKRHPLVLAPEWDFGDEAAQTLTI